MVGPSVLGSATHDIGPGEAARVAAARTVAEGTMALGARPCIRGV
jgi:hypothetical protein